MVCWCLARNQKLSRWIIYKVQVRLITTSPAGSSRLARVPCHVLLDHSWLILKSELDIIATLFNFSFDFFSILSMRVWMSVWGIAEIWRLRGRGRSRKTPGVNEFVRWDMYLLGLKLEWVVNRDAWRDLIWSKRVARKKWRFTKLLILLMMMKFYAILNLNIRFHQFSKPSYKLIVFLFNIFIWRSEISELFSTTGRSTIASIASGSIVGMEGAASMRRVSSMRRTFTSGGSWCQAEINQSAS